LPDPLAVDKPTTRPPTSVTGSIEAHASQRLAKKPIRLQ
jgi:hypothetical protein